jgi:hypothetical protein
MENIKLEKINMENIVDKDLSVNMEKPVRTIKYFFSEIDLIIDQINYGNSNNSGMGRMPKITVINNGCFEVAESHNPNDVVIHNFANNKIPGGPCSLFTPDGIFISNQQWANTQEDQLVKLYKKVLVLPLDMYPICKDNKPGNEGLLYSTCGNKLCDVITIPALQDPNYIKLSDRQTMINRIKFIITICAKYKKKLITGLWGCGVFGGNPSDLAQLWRTALSDVTIPRPDEIIFAIRIDGASSRWGTFSDNEKLFKSIIN